MTTRPLGIMTAMPEEADAILASFAPGVRHIEHGCRTFHIGTLFGVDAIAVVARCGKVSAATTTAELILRFDVSRIVFTGVAGALDPAVNIGDVVIADKLVQHDLDATPIWPPRVVPFLDIAEFPADAGLSSSLRRAAADFLASDEAQPAAVEMSSAATPRTTHTGLIASGDQFIACADRGRAIRDAIPGVLCVEMEGAAVAQVAYEYNIPVAVCRVISDRADHDATADYTQSLGQFASSYSAGIIRHLLAPSSA